ncbi:MAG: hypothetical protein ACJ0RQ_10005 [Candidatus Azotimanducaceae bacterium]
MAITHNTADPHGSRRVFPMILHWPGLLEGARYSAKHYHVDIFATVLELLERKVPDAWDGESFATALKNGIDQGRDFLVVSQAAWACQRGVRFDDYLYLNTRHDAFHLWDDELLFNVQSDPYQQNNLAPTSLAVLAEGRDLLDRWLGDMMVDAARGRDPHDNVMREGGPYHVRGKLESYLRRLRHRTPAARSSWPINWLTKYPNEL